MSTSPSTPDPTMDAISAAVLRGCDGDTESARRDLLSLWQRIGAAGDAFHRCTLAHYLADLYDDPAESLVWDVRALDAADALTDERAGPPVRAPRRSLRRHHPHGRPRGASGDRRP